MKIEIDKAHYERYVEIYNDQGTQAAKDYVTGLYSMDINQFQRKMRRETDYIFSKSSKKYEKSAAEAEPFMSLEELCTNTRSPRTAKESPRKNGQAFNELIFELMRDRLIELQRFIRIDQATKEIDVDKKLAKDYGYTITIS